MEELHLRSPRPSLPPSSGSATRVLVEPGAQLWHNCGATCLLHRLGCLTPPQLPVRSVLALPVLHTSRQVAGMKSLWQPTRFIHVPGKPPSVRVAAFRPQQCRAIQQPLAASCGAAPPLPAALVPSRGAAMWTMQSPSAHTYERTLTICSLWCRRFSSSSTASASCARRTSSSRSARKASACGQGQVYATQSCRSEMRLVAVDFNPALNMSNQLCTPT